MPHNAYLSLSIGLFCGSALLAGCGPTCEEVGCGEIPVTPTPIPGTAVYGEAFISNPPLTWGLKREVLQEVFVPGELGMDDVWYPQVTRTYFIVKWIPQSDGTMKQEEQICSMDTSEVFVELPQTVKSQVTVVPDRLIDHLPTDTWSFQFDVVTDASVTYETAEYTLLPSEYGPQYDVWGAAITDPTTETCPVDAKADGWVDQDEDGYYGVTLEMWLDGEFYCKTMACQRFLYRQDPAIVTFLGEGSYRIIGRMVDVLVDQSQYGSIDEPWPAPVDDQDPEVQWSDNDQTYYIMTSLPDGSTCENVTPDLFL